MRKMSLDIFVFLLSFYNFKDKLDTTTFKSASEKCRFVDIEHGEYWAKPTDILCGKTKGHPKRGIKKASISRMVSKDEAQMRIGNYKIISYNGFSKKCLFEDEFGNEFEAIPKDLYKKLRAKA